MKSFTDKKNRQTGKRIAEAVISRHMGAIDFIGVWRPYVIPSNTSIPGISDSRTIEICFQKRGSVAWYKAYWSENSVRAIRDIKTDKMILEDVLFFRSI